MNLQLNFSDADLNFTGTVIITVNSSPAAEKVDYYVDNVFKATRTSSPDYAWSWLTTGVADGSHVVKAIATYRNGRTETASKSVIVTNAANPPADTTPPSVPGSFAKSTSTQTSITTTWTASTDAVGVTGYNLYKNGVLVASITPATTYTFTGLTCSSSGSSYSLSIEAFDAAGNKSAKSTITATTVACTNPPPPTPPPPPTVKPAIPTGFTAVLVNNGTQVQLDWAANSTSDQVDYYQVYMDDAVVTLTISGRSWISAVFPAGVTHTWRVSAHNVVGYGDWTNAISRTMGGTTPPPTGNVVKRFDRFSDWTGLWNVYKSNFGDGWQAPPWTAPPQVAWPQGGGIFEVSTIKGNGLKFICTDEMPVWSVDSKLCQGAWQPGWTGIGKIEWHRNWLYFPAADNPTGWPSGWTGNVLDEWGIDGPNGVSVGHQTFVSDTGRLGFGVRNQTTQFPTFVRYMPDALAYDTWIWREVGIKWSTGSDGFIRVTFGTTLLINYSGPTIFSGETPRSYQAGLYAPRQKRNCVIFADWRIEDS